MKKIIVFNKPGIYELEIESFYKKSDTRGEVVVKGIVNDGVDVRVKGRVRIGKNIKNIESSLEMRMLLLGKNARVTLVPEMEIESNEVRAMHAATVSKINEEELFYLMSKGVTRKKAENLLIKGFLATITDKMKNNV